MTGRDRTVVLVVVVLVAIVAGWLLVISPKRSEAGKLGTQVSAAETKLATERSTVEADEAARASFASSYAEVARLGEAVPADDDVPSMLYQLQHAADQAGVDFRSLTLNAQASSSTPAPAPTTSSSKTSTGSSSTSSASTASASTAADTALPPGAAVGPAGFPTENFTLTFQGNFFHLSNFFKRLDAFVEVTNRRVLVSGRLMTVNAISLGPGAGGFPAMEASVSTTTYLVPAAQGLTAGATPGGPSVSGTSSVSGSANPSAVAPATVTP